jgi:hypothetical protein
MAKMKRPSKPIREDEAEPADTSLRLIPSLYKDVRRWALDSDRSASSVVNESMRDFLRAKSALSDQAKKDFDDYLKKRSS